MSYKTLPNSTSDARYTVYHKDGKTEFAVNQQMGGGTWIYLGTFAFDKGTKGKVVLSNLSKDKNSVVTADAVRFGGGMGNIARTADGNLIWPNSKKDRATDPKPRNEWQPKLNIPYETSGYPRFLEGARYYMQWAGVPDSIYSPSHGMNEYSDDYKNRGVWVNWLAGGTKAVPDSKGLNIPVDLSFAFHSDAGTVYGDSIIGTLGIYDSRQYDGTFADGSSRAANHDLCDHVLSSICNDIRTLYEPKWTRRGMWDSRYFEAWSPRVPAMLLELLSHENFADMRYGLDPRFHFTVGRSVYKGILKFLSDQYGYDYVVQPLPVEHFAAVLNDKRQVELSWQPVDDPLEPTAKAEKYIVYKRIGNGDFDNGTVVKKTRCVMDVPADEVVSFKIAALNQGGESFPSEILSVGIASASTAKPVLVVNGFDRTGAPDDFRSNDDEQAGFLADDDNGVPYKQMISYVGKMKEFRRAIPWTDDDAAGYGDSYGNYEKLVIKGNTFDYPALHGQSILKAGYSFVSVSKAALADHAYMNADLSTSSSARRSRARWDASVLSRASTSRPSTRPCSRPSPTIARRAAACSSAALMWLPTSSRTLSSRPKMLTRSLLARSLSMSGATTRLPVKEPSRPLPLRSQRNVPTILIITSQTRSRMSWSRPMPSCPPTPPPTLASATLRTTFPLAWCSVATKPISGVPWSSASPSRASRARLSATR